MPNKKDLFRYLLNTGLLIPALVQAQAFDSSRNQTVLATYEFNSFNQATRYNWQQGSVEYKKQWAQLSFLGRFNYGRRFDQLGWQGEVEAYPRLSPKVYAYTAVGFSPGAPVFPRWRSGASLFVNLPGAWEVEGGVRYLRFDRDVWLLSAGLGKYLGNWFIQSRGFFSLNNRQGFDQSYLLTARYYLPSGTNYLWLQAGTGISPDETQAIQLQGLNLQRQLLAGGVRTTIARRHQLLGTLGYARNEYSKDTYGSQFTLVLGYGVKF